MPAMRDAFFNKLYTYARENRDVVVLSADFSAPSLDQFRLNIPDQYIFTGISEQSMMLLAAGMALEGKRPFCYAIAPFITMRCFEQTRLYAAGMDLPITLVGVGAGTAYNDSGYTHHALEDIALMRTLPHMKILQPCDNQDAVQAAEYAMNARHPLYVRLDRYGVDAFYAGERNLETGLSVIYEPQPVTLLASGSMVRIALEARERLRAQGRDAGVLNANAIPLDPEAFRAAMAPVQTLITLEEHTLPGGLGSHVLELVSDLGLSLRIKRLGFDLSDGYIEEFGGRDQFYRQYRMDAGAVLEIIRGMGEKTHE